MLFAGQVVRIGNSCPRLENGARLQAARRTQDRGHNVTNMGRTKAAIAVNKVFFPPLLSVLKVTFVLRFRKSRLV